MPRLERIHGLAIPAPRFTRWALVYFLKFVALPGLLLLLLADVALYFVFRHWLDACYGVLCFFQ
ncbi:hypothetical protein FNB15_08430 [Ferrovibrio terrae]|uniref:Uncharacterized protein n=1 Tax=Ferrovibrio terrae TaxID=2594003 RepID=A0A516H0L2_9PROT|nr:hypothetical protein [Ferrovibrio terrae]QDO97292.1 hypothetical protein FNB15_08430 [Ferrovibrio terrae]